VVVLDLAGDLRLVWRRIEARDATDAAAPRDEAVPRGCDVVAERCDGAQAGDDDASAHAVAVPFSFAARSAMESGSEMASVFASTMRLMRPLTTWPAAISPNGVDPPSGTGGTR